MVLFDVGSMFWARILPVTMYFHEEAQNVSSVLWVLAGVDDYCLGSVFHWGFQNGDVLISSFLLSSATI